ncbi:MAG TPA: CmcJ/NvfI family oxidoreductase [Caulobacteraceae bacterium]|nr:CmcJ/NvfI family oxidoreductase [Caulobacteraceae bacterium]
MSDVALEARTVEASVNYMLKTEEKPVSETGGQDGLVRRYTGTPDPHVVRIADGRGQGFSLDVAGFELTDHPTRMRDFYDPAELERVYYPEMQRLIAARAGAHRVHIFDHTLRHSDEAVRLERKIREPVRSVHNDYTEWSGPNRVREILPDEANALLQRRFAVIQVWRATTRQSSAIRSPSSTRAASRRRTSSPPSAGSRTASAKSTCSSTTPTTAGRTSRVCGATRLWCSRSTTRLRTAAPAGAPKPASSTLTPVRTPRRARASRSGRSRSSSSPAPGAA